MRRVVCTEWGEPEKLVLEDSPDPEPGPGQAVVEVAAAGVNFVDALFVAGTYQIKVPPPFTPGSELAGTVLAVGDGVTDIGVGDRVLSSLGLGAFASHVVVPAGSLTLIPDNLSSPAAAALAQSYCTAWFALTRRTTIKAGETVLVLGAGGGVGLASIDVARHLGARVIAAASSADKLADATAMGAIATIAYEDEDLKVRARELADGQLDVVIDPVGGHHSEAALRALGPGGRLVVIGFAAGDIPSLRTNLVLLNNRSVVGVDWGAWAMRSPAEQSALLTEILDGVAAGELHPRRRPNALSPRPGRCSGTSSNAASEARPSWSPSPDLSDPGAAGLPDHEVQGDEEDQVQESAVHRQLLLGVLVTLGGLLLGRVHESKHDAHARHPQQGGDGQPGLAHGEELLAVRGVTRHPGQPEPDEPGHHVGGTVDLQRVPAGQAVDGGPHRLAGLAQPHRHERPHEGGGEGHDRRSDVDQQHDPVGSTSDGSEHCVLFLP